MKLFKILNESTVECNVLSWKVIPLFLSLSLSMSDNLRHLYDNISLCVVYVRDYE
jgi:hypothetical protein